MKEGKNSLILIYKNDDIVGGTYYLSAQEDQILQITGAGYNLNLQPMEIGMLYKQAFNVLSSKKYFPKADKLLVCSRNLSDKVASLKQFGFIESNNVIETERPVDTFLVLERPVI